jgi:hypothetical protein
MLFLVWCLLAVLRSQTMSSQTVLLTNKGSRRVLSSGSRRLLGIVTRGVDGVDGVREWTAAPEAVAADPSTRRIHLAGRRGCWSDAASLHPCGWVAWLLLLARG